MNDFSRFAMIDPRPVDAMSHAQIALVLGLEHVLQQAGLILTCPRCAFDGLPLLETHNARGDDVWKIDCACRKRRVNGSGVIPMAPSGDLLLMVDEMLGPLGLTVRCPNSRCINRPLQLQRSNEGLVVTCHCGATMKFQKTHHPVTH